MHYDIQTTVKSQRNLTEINQNLTSRSSEDTFFPFLPSASERYYEALQAAPVRSRRHLMAMPADQLSGNCDDVPDVEDVIRPLSPIIPSDRPVFSPPVPAVLKRYFNQK